MTFDNALLNGSLVIAVGGSGGGTAEPTSVAGTLNGTFTIDRKQAQTADAATVWIASYPNSAYGVDTVTVTQALGTLRWAIAEYTGAELSSPLDQTNSAQANSVTHVASGDITTTTRDTLLLGVSRNSTNATWATTANYGLACVVPVTVGTQRLVLEERWAAATGTFNSDPDDGISNQKCTLIAAYKLVTPPVEFLASEFPKHVLATSFPGVGGSRRA